MRRPLDDCDDPPAALIRRLGDAHGQNPDVVIDAILDVIQAARDLYVVRADVQRLTPTS